MNTPTPENPHPGDNHALYIVRTWVPEDQLQERERWHTGVHIPQVLHASGALSAVKHRVADDGTGDWQAQYVTIYEFPSLEAYHAYSTSEVAARLRQDYRDRYGSTGKISRQVVVHSHTTLTTP